MLAHRARHVGYLVGHGRWIQETGHAGTRSELAFSSLLNQDRRTASKQMSEGELHFPIQETETSRWSGIVDKVSTANENDVRREGARIFGIVHRREGNWREN